MKTHIIYLAAGNSIRFGSHKLFYIFNGKELYRHGLDELIQLIQIRHDCELHIVTQYKKIKEDYPDCHVVMSPLSVQGISYSIQTGIQNLDEGNIMFVVGDQPNLIYQTMSDMIDCFQASSYGLASCIYQGQVGNPTIFSPKYKEELMALKDDEGGRKIIKAHQDDCFYYEVKNQKELKDIDTHDDL